METLAAALVAACASIVSALIAARASRSADAAKAEQESYQQARLEQERERRYIDEATAQGMIAVLDAVDVSLVALQGGHLDGNVEEARAGIKDARTLYAQTRSKAISRLL